MLRTLHVEPALARVCHPTNSANRSARLPGPVPSALLGIFAGLLAILDGLAAYRRFEHLRSRGIAHDTALRRALGIAHPRG
jgi:hypothetical protein